MVNEYYKEHKYDYFEYNGEKYYLGTKFTLKGDYDCICDAVFTGWDKYDSNLCNIQYKYPYERCKYMIDVPREKMQNLVVSIREGNHFEAVLASEVVPPDSSIPDVACAWVLYIVIMAILTLFNQRIVGWIFVSAYFFNWRSKRKKQETYYTYKGW